MAAKSADAKLEDDDYTTTVSGVIVDDTGAMICLLSMYDGESHYCRLTPIADILQPPPAGEVATIYDYRGWITDLFTSTDGTLLCCDASGNVHVRRDMEWSITRTGAESLRAIWASNGNTIFAVGTDGLVWSNLGGEWQPISDNFGVWLNDVVGLRDDRIMVVGDSGFAASWNGETWTAVDLPTSGNLNAVHPLNETDWIVGGSGGTLFRGSGDTWTDLSAPLDGVFGFADSQGELWLACGSSGVGILSPDGSVEMMRDTFAARRIHAAGVYIAFAGNDIAARYDGQNWKGRRFK